MILNPYSVLGVEIGTPLSECKKKYRQLAKLYHPDSLTGDKDKFDAIAKAFDMIESGKFSITVHKRDKLSHRSLFSFCIN